MKLEIANLTKLVEQGAGLTHGQESSMNELLKVKDELSNERDKLLDELVKLRNQLEDANQKQLNYEKKMDDANSMISQVSRQI